MTIPAHDLYQQDDLPAGHIPRHDPGENIESYAAEETIPFGYGVSRGTDLQNQVEVFDGSADVFAGVAVASPVSSDIDNQQYLVDDSVGVMTRGFINVVCGEVVNAGDPVRVRHTANGSLLPGYFQKSADAGKTCLLDGAQWVNTITASGVNTLRLGGIFKTTADT